MPLPIVGWPYNRIYVIWSPGLGPTAVDFSSRPHLPAGRQNVSQGLSLPLWSSSRDKLYFNLLTQHLLQGPRYALVEPL